MAAIARSVGARNSSGTATRRPKRSRMRGASWMVFSESPPSVRKASSRPIRSIPSSSDQIAASVVSVSPCGATNALAANASASGSGSALRSSLPLGVSGHAVIRT